MRVWHGGGKRDARDPTRGTASPNKLLVARGPFSFPKSRRKSPGREFVSLLNRLRDFFLGRRGRVPSGEGDVEGFELFLEGVVARDRDGGVLAVGGVDAAVL